MVYTAYSCEKIKMKRICVADGGLANGNNYAVIEILYNEDEDEVDSVWYKEFGKNPVSKWIGNEVEWCEDDTFKILNDGQYIDSEDEEEEKKWEICCERASGMRCERFEFDSESEARAEYNKMVEDEGKEPRWESIHLNYDNDCVDCWTCPEAEFKQSIYHEEMIENNSYHFC